MFIKFCIINILPELHPVINTVLPFILIVPRYTLVVIHKYNLKIASSIIVEKIRMV